METKFTRCLFLESTEKEKRVAAVADKEWDVQIFHSTWQKKCRCDSLHTSLRRNTANTVAFLPPQTGGAAQNAPIFFPELKAYC